MEFRKSASGQTIIVTDNQYNEFGLPTSLKTGIIRPKLGSDVDMLVGALQAGRFAYKFGQQGQNGIYEMDFVGVVTPAATPVNALETA